MVDNSSVPHPNPSPTSPARRKPISNANPDKALCQSHDTDTPECDPDLFPSTCLHEHRVVSCKKYFRTFRSSSPPAEVFDSDAKASDSQNNVYIIYTFFSTLIYFHKYRHTHTPDRRALYASLSDKSAEGAEVSMRENRECTFNRKIRPEKVPVFTSARPFSR